MRRSKDIFRKYSSVHIWVQIPIGLRMKSESAYDKHCEEVDRMAGRGNGIGGGGFGPGGWYDHSIYFDSDSDGRLNEQRAAKFIQNYKKKHPKHRVRLVTVETLGHTFFYGKQNTATKPCLGTIATFIKQLAK
jgi:hypothetical protein